MSGHGRHAARAFAIVALIFFTVRTASAQCPAENPQPGLLQVPTQDTARAAAKAAKGEPVLTEAGFLSNTHYTSQFFGFSFDLPLTVEGHEIMMPLMPEKQHALLALQFEEGQQRGSILVTAYDPVPGYDVNLPEQGQKEIDNWAKQGTQAGRLPPLPVPPFMLRSGHFYHRFTRRGRNYAAQYWVGINNYSIRILIATNDEHFLHKAKDAMADARFYCRQDDGTLTAEDGKAVRPPGQPYFGPTVPTSRVNEALQDQPAKNIPMGDVADGLYRNAELGFTYRLPEGWTQALPAEGDPPLESTALREYRFLHSCSQTLLQATPADHKPAGGADPVIVLRALDPNCLVMRTATSLTDKRAADEVAASLEQLGEFGAIGSDELVSISGHLFMVFHGTIGTAPRGEALAPRLSETMFATRYNKLVLVWSFLAQDATALHELPTGEILFESSAAIHLRTSGDAKR